MSSRYTVVQCDGVPTLVAFDYQTVRLYLGRATETEAPRFKIFSVGSTDGRDDPVDMTSAFAHAWAIAIISRAARRMRSSDEVAEDMPAFVRHAIAPLTLARWVRDEIVKAQAGAADEDGEI